MKWMLKRTILLLALCLCIGWQASAMEPSEPPKTLAERVREAPIIIVGIAKRVRVMTSGADADGKPQAREVAPEPKILEMGQSAVVEIQVSEVLYQAPAASESLGAWKTARPVHLWFGGGFFEVKSVREDTMGQKKIYLLMPWEWTPPETETWLLPSHEWHLCQSIEQRSGIEALVKERVEREQRAQKAAASTSR